MEIKILLVSLRIRHEYDDIEQAEAEVLEEEGALVLRPQIPPRNQEDGSVSRHVMRSLPFEGKD